MAFQSPHLPLYPAFSNVVFFTSKITVSEFFVLLSQSHPWWFALLHGCNPLAPLTFESTRSGSEKALGSPSTPSALHAASQLSNKWSRNGWATGMEALTCDAMFESSSSSEDAFAWEVEKVCMLDLYLCSWLLVSIFMQHGV